MKADEFNTLVNLLKTESKKDVIKLCDGVVQYVDQARAPDHLVQLAVSVLKISHTEAKETLQSLKQLLKRALFDGEGVKVGQLFPDSFHKNLKVLLVNVIEENLVVWRSQMASKNVSLPRLIDFDWRVDVKSASDTIARMSVPTCILQLKVDGEHTQVGSSLNQENINVELSKETLDTMLDGLSKIRDQLSSVAKR